MAVDARTSSSLAPPPPMALFIFLAVFAVQVLLRVCTHLLPVSRVSPFLLSKPYYFLWLFWCYGQHDFDCRRRGWHRRRLNWCEKSKSFFGRQMPYPREFFFWAFCPSKVHAVVCSMHHLIAHYLHTCWRCGPIKRMGTWYVVSSKNEL